MLFTNEFLKFGTKLHQMVIFSLDWTEILTDHPGNRLDDLQNVISIFLFFLYDLATTYTFSNFSEPLSDIINTENQLIH